MVRGDDAAADHVPPAFKDLLRSFRLAAGLSQEALAERARLSVRAISDLERGVKLWPRPETIQLLAGALDLALEDRAALTTAARRPSRPRSARDSRSPPPSVADHNLPVQTTSFIGRGREQAEVMALLETHHLVTVAGSGGAGKTRLALQVAGGLLTSYPDGIWQVELAQLSDPTLVPRAIAATLALREEPGVPLPASLAEYLKPRRMLLLLDNCEHLIVACAEMISVLLRGCPELRVLATSREELRVPGESVYRVPPLSLPDPNRAPMPEALLAFEAAQLFVERARDRRFDFTVNVANADAVAQICRRLDGIPLAIELAAARIGVLTAEEIAGRLDDAFRLLTGGSQTVLPRHQTLRAVFDWSHDLLGEQERALLRRLSVFAGGWTLDAAQAICAGDLALPPQSARALGGNGYPTDAAEQPDRAEPFRHPHGQPLVQTDDAPGERPRARASVAQEDVLDLLDALINKSLVLMHPVGHATWYRLLETVRQYEHERLTEAGELVLLRDRHLEWYLALAAEAQRGLAGAEQALWLERLEREHDNLRAALAWGLQAQDRQAGMELAARLLLFWEAHGHLTEARRWLDDLLARGEGAPHEVRARALHCAGALAISQGDYARAAALLEKSLALERQVGDSQGIAAVLQALGVVALYQGDYGAAAALFEESLALRRAIGDPWGVAAALGNLGQAVFMQGDRERAISFHEESLALRRQLGNKRGIAVSLNELGMIAWSQRNHALAATLYEESLALRRDLGDRGGIAVSLSNLAEAHIAQGVYDRAAGLLREALALAQEIGDKQVMACGLESVATVAMARGAPRDAAALFGAAEALREHIGLPLPPPARADYERTTAAVRAALDDDTFSAAHARGRTLPLDQAIALALAYADGADTSPPDQAPGT